MSVFKFALAERDWDDAFSVAVEFDMAALLEPLIRAGLDDLLSVGRLPTLRRWVEAANGSSKNSSAAVRIAEAEIAFRDGSHTHSQALAEEAVDELSDEDELRGRGLFRAGQAAYFSEQYETALKHFHSCVRASRDPSLEREARWAAFIAALDSHHPETLTYLNEFASVREPNLNDAVRMANAELVVSINRDGVTEAVAAHAGASHLARRATNPMIRTAFWNTYGWALALNSRYEDAQRAASNELEDAKTYGLSFVEPHAQLLAALAAVGLRDLASGDILLQKVLEFARSREDPFLLLNASAVLARLQIARGDCSEAVAATAAFHPSSSIRCDEYLSIRAVALAAVEARDEARTAIAAVPNSASCAEARAFAGLANLILAYSEDVDPVATARDTIAKIQAYGQFDAFVTAYRAFPQLIDLGIQAGYAEFIVDMISRANDGDLGRRYGITVCRRAQTSTSALSPREEQVLDLVAEGRTNEEVADLLFISPVTVKAHLRHIYEKLGVRNRVEAAALLTKERALESST